VALNLRGSVMCTCQAMRIIKAQRCKRSLNIDSIAAHETTLPYATSEFGC